MEKFISLITSNWLEILTIMVLGGFSLFQLFWKGMKEKRDVMDGADDRLIKLLQGTVGELERKVKELEGAHLKNSEEIQKLKTENGIMAQLLQGRDQRTIEFQESVIRMLGENSTAIKDLYVVIEKHLVALES